MGTIPRVIGCALLLTASFVANAAHITVFQALLNGDQAGSDAAGLGSATATLNSDDGEFKWFIAWEGLSGAATAGHFHGPALAGANAGIEVGFDHTVNPTVGEAFLSTEQQGDLLDELWYINIHTDAFPGGEIRGQVLLVNTVNAAAVPLPAGALLFAPALGGLFFAGRRKAAA